MDKEVEIIENQTCPICMSNTLKIISSTRDIPFFGEVYVFSMFCNECKFFKADVEASEPKDPKKYEIDISSKEDMNIRIVRSSEGSIRIPRMIDLEPGIAAQGFVSNVEGVLNRFISAIEKAINSEEDNDKIKKGKNMIKKLRKVTWGQETIKLVIEDPTGNSAIISEKAVISPLKIKK